MINGDITGTHSVGGIVGRAYSNSNLESLSFSGNIQGTDCVGGITGGLEAPNYLKKCINYGNINALTRVGGISGYLYESKIVDSINCGNVIGENEVGGIVGKHDNYFRGTYTSYNRGNIVCSGEKKGAIVGNNEIGFIDDGSQNNYYLMQTGLDGITIATPVRSDAQLSATVGQHINVYHTGDSVQAKLGGRIQNWGSAGRTFNGATNISIPKSAIPGNSQGPIASHGAMHNSAWIWRNYIKPKIN